MEKFVVKNKAAKLYRRIQPKRYREGNQSAAGKGTGKACDPVAHGGFWGKGFSDREVQKIQAQAPGEKWTIPCCIWRPE
ncbi:MAG: hypothetical protein ACLUOI_20290 [Eisenbergiella sp.]